MQLLDPLTNTVLWLDKYPCTEKELFEVQDKVALQVFDKLGISLTDDQKALFGKKEEINEKARKLIERGLYYYDNKSYPLALESFQQALKEDESYFRTHYYLGQTYQAMERWKEAIEEYQLALPEAEKFKRVKYTCQFLDSLPEEIELYRSEDGKVVGYWYDPKDETMNWKCVDILNGRVLFEKKIRAEKGTVCIQDSSYRQLWLGWRDNTSIPTDLIKHKVYMINTNGDLLWEFGDSTSDFSYAINYGPYVRVANERNDSLYLLDRNGLFLAMVESDKQATVWYDYFFGYDGVSRKLYTRSIKKLDKIITRSLHLGEYYNRNISAIVDTTNLSNYIITHIGLTDLKNKFELDAAPFNEYNCRLGKDHLFCFANDSNLYAYRIEKPFYQERLAWRTHIGEPRSGKSSLEGSFLYVYGVLDTVVVMTKSADLYGLDVKKGEVAWHVNIGNRLSDANMQTVIRNNNLIIFTRSDISVIDIRSGELKWTKNTRYYSNEIYHDLILAWTTKDILSALQIDDGSVAFSCRTEHAWLDTVNNRIFYGSSIEFKELNPEIYQSGGKLQEDQIMKQIGICYFRLENNEKADSIFTYVTDELGIEDPDCYYYKYLIQKKVGRNDSSIVYLENYYDLIKDIRIDKEKEARQMFQDDHGVSIIRNRAVEHRESFRRVFALDSLLLVAGSSIAGFQYTLEPPRASYYTGPGKLSLCAIDKSTGLLVWDTTIDGILPNKILQENKLLFENYVHNTSTKRVGFSIKLLGLDSRKLLWERQLIEGSDETSCFKILAADSNHICAYFQDPFWPSGADTRLPKDSADFHFWLLNAKTGEVEKGKQIRLSADTNTFANIYADEDYVLIPLEKKIIVLDIETFEQHWQIETSAPITSLTSNENIIYIGTMNKCYSAYDEKTRTLVWRSKLPFPLESGYIPAITYLRENTFLDYWDNKNIFCFDLRSGITDDRRIRWRFKVDSVCPDAELSWWQTWKLEKDKLFVNLDNCKEFTYIILERNTGKFLKGVKLPWSDVYGSRVVVSDNTIYCLTGDGLFYKMECFK
jgi:outer membrane protein assembly factor BamB